MNQKEFYSNIYLVISRYISIGIFLILGIIIFIIGKILPSIFFLSISLFLFILFFLVKENKKQFFSKIRVNDIGICKFYKNEIIHEIKWEDLIEVRCYKECHLIFLDYIANDAEIENYEDTNVTVLMTAKSIKSIALFKEHFKHKITDINGLGQYEKDKLL